MCSPFGSRVAERLLGALGALLEGGAPDQASADAAHAVRPPTHCRTPAQQPPLCSTYTLPACTLDCAQHCLPPSSRSCPCNSHLCTAPSLPLCDAYTQLHPQVLERASCLHASWSASSVLTATGAIAGMLPACKPVCEPHFHCPVQALERTCRVVTAHLYQFATDRNGSHVARALLCVLAGRDVAPAQQPRGGIAGVDAAALRRVRTHCRRPCCYQTRGRDGAVQGFLANTSTYSALRSCQRS
jgi:hypothetical protein